MDKYQQLSDQISLSKETTNNFPKFPVPPPKDKCFVFNVILNWISSFPTYCQVHQKSKEAFYLGYQMDETLKQQYPSEQLKSSRGNLGQIDGLLINLSESIPKIINGAYDKRYDLCSGKFTEQSTSEFT